MKVLGIETSCDDCCVSIVEKGQTILSNVSLTQQEHKMYYGIVPELASRLHAKYIMLIYKQALKEAQIKKEEIDLIAVTVKPGLIGSLIVGTSFAKGLSIALQKPIVGIDHILGHLYAPLINEYIEYPFLALVLSGGHTLLVKQNNFDDIEVLGKTLDDSCGEAFDKIAKYYDMGFPGGPNIEKLALKGNENAFNFPITIFKKKEHWYDMSYSGLKTACIHQSNKFHNSKFEKNKENISASFQRCAFENLMIPLKRAIKTTKIKKIIITGGVASNNYLRQKLQSLNVKIYYPPLNLCQDNAAMIAGIGYHHFKKYGESKINIEVNSRVQLYKNFKIK